VGKAEYTACTVTFMAPPALGHAAKVACWPATKYTSATASDGAAGDALQLPDRGTTAPGAVHGGGLGHETTGAPGHVALAPARGARGVRAVGQETAKQGF
jgi:hypothetical protein